MKRFAGLLLSVATLSLAHSAFAASEYKWIGQITEDGAALSYAIPESDAIKFDFHCDRKTKKIVVNFEHEPKAVKDGMQLTVQLSVRGRDTGIAVEIPMKGQRLELDDKFLLQGETRMSPQLRRVLSESGTLLVTVNSRDEEIPLKGVAQAAKPLNSGLSLANAVYRRDRHRLKSAAIQIIERFSSRTSIAKSAVLSALVLPSTIQPFEIM